MSDVQSAGDFRAWLAEIEPARRGAGETSVPCATCTACCRSSQFIHVGPDETDALAHIPPEVLFTAPGGAPGQMVMGYDERGWCPMLSDTGCTIYDYRPRTCRSYDCRIFAAVGVGPDERDQPDLAARARSWVFEFSDDPTATDRRDHNAVQAAARFLRDHAAELPSAVRPANATGLALLAIDIRRLFEGNDPTLGEVVAALR